MFKRGDLVFVKHPESTSEAWVVSFDRVDKKEKVNLIRNFGAIEISYPDGDFWGRGYLQNYEIVRQANSYEVSCFIKKFLKDKHSGQNPLKKYSDLIIFNCYTKNE